MNQTRFEAHSHTYFLVTNDGMENYTIYYDYTAECWVIWHITNDRTEFR